MNSSMLLVLLASFVVIYAVEKEDAPVRYKFAYGVDDRHTGDHHQQHEVRDGHVVRGSYSLKEADGTTRIVDYVAGPHSGFNAVVRRVGHAQHPQHYPNWRFQEEGYQNGGQESFLGSSR